MQSIRNTYKPYGGLVIKLKHEQKQRRHDYAALKRKILMRVLIAAAFAVIAVFVCRMITIGRLADQIVHTFSEMFKIDTGAARNIYQFGIRNYLETLLAIAIIVFIVIGFRLIVKSFTIYLDEIAEGIDHLSTDQDVEIKLSPELGFVENRLRNLQQKLVQKEQKARQSEQRKNDLIIYSAHDIRTPLTSALGYLILLDGNPDLPVEERKKYTRIALAKTRELDGMISELFEITRYNLHDISLEKTSVDLYSMLLQMREEYYPRLHADNKQLLLDMDDNIIVYGDAEKLARAFQNLLKNAIAYSKPDNNITVTAQQSVNAITINFQNCCDLVPPDKLAHLFDPFFRMDKSRATDAAGAGLGLAITKEILELHNGTIRAENTDGGIRFIITLPVQTPTNH